MGIKEIILLIAGFALILYVGTLLKEWVNPEKKETKKSDEEYAQESLDELIVKGKKDEVTNKDKKDQDDQKK